MLAADVTAEWFTMQLHIYGQVFRHILIDFVATGSDAEHDRSTVCLFKKCVATFVSLLYWQNLWFMKYVTM